MIRPGFVTPLLMLGVIACSQGSDGESPPVAPVLSDEVSARRAGLRDDLRAQLGAEYDQAIPEPTEQQLAAGRKTYGALCAPCHGQSGKGNGRSARGLSTEIPDIGDPTIAAFFSDRAKLEIIRQGVPGTPMIGWEGMLNDEQSVEVLQFMRTLVRPSDPRRAPASP